MCTSLKFLDLSKTQVHAKLLISFFGGVSLRFADVIKKKERLGEEGENERDVEEVVWISAAIKAAWLPDGVGDTH